MSQANSLPYRLRLPGPSAVPARVQQAMMGPVLNHRGPEFSAIMAASNAMMQPLLGTANNLLVFASSGTGVMEASLANALGAGERALILSSGSFGDRFLAIAASLGIETDALTAPWGEVVPPDQVARQLNQQNYRAVVAVHNESSTGAVVDLAALGEVVAASDAILIVDSISGAGGIEMRQDDWGVDILIMAGQKALMCPPGLGLVTVSNKAWKQIEQEPGKSRYYWDFRKARAEADDHQTPFTSPVTLVAGLHEALTMIHEEGVNHVIARHQFLADALRAGGEALGLTVFTQSAIKSNTVTVFSTPPEIDGNQVVAQLHARYNTVIAGARNWMAGKVIRIGTMGNTTAADIVTDLEFLGQTLHGLGLAIDPEQGASEAKRRLGKMAEVA